MDCETCTLTYTGSQNGQISGAADSHVTTYGGLWVQDDQIWAFFLTEPLNKWSHLSINETDFILILSESRHICVGWRSATKGKYTTTIVQPDTHLSESNEKTEATETNEKEPPDFLIGEDLEEGTEVSIQTNLFWNGEMTIINTTPQYLLSFFTTSTNVRECILTIRQEASVGYLPIGKEDRCRLGFLNDTVKLITDLVSSQSQEVRLTIPFAMLLQNVSTRMEDVLVTLKRIKRLETTITGNFDIFELKLRSHWEELTSLFPPNASSISSPWSLISDVEASGIWIKSFGDDYYITFEQLVKTVNIEVIAAGDEALTDRMVKCLRYLVNFPEDDMITTYKFNQLVCLFGLHDFRKNFQNLTEVKGFCGLINRIEAYEILSKSADPLPFLFRISRTEPRFFAFSYRNPKGQICHRVNKDREGHPIQVETFIRKYFPNYKIVDKHLDLDRIFNETSSINPLSKYASSAGYCH